jgi:hypothetical protein
VVKKDRSTKRRTMLLASLPGTGHHYLMNEDINGRSHYLSIMITQIVVLTFEIRTNRCTGKKSYVIHSKNGILFPDYGTSSKGIISRQTSTYIKLIICLCIATILIYMTYDKFYFNKAHKIYVFY